MRSPCRRGASVGAPTRPPRTASSFCEPSSSCCSSLRSDCWGDTGAIRSDRSVSEDDNVLVRGVAGDQGAIGFFGCAYYFENTDKLKAVPIINPGTNEPVEPTPQTIESGAYATFGRPLFIYVNAKSLAKPQVKAFIAFYLEKGPELAEEVGYVRLPDEIKRRVEQNIQHGRTGTQFLNATGDKVRGPLTEVYR